MLRDAAAGNVAGPYEGYTKTRGVVVASSSRIAPPALLTLGTTINARRCAQCACPHVDPFLTVLEDIWSMGAIVLSVDGD